MAFNYFKDPKFIFLAIFAIAFCIVWVIAGPEFWYVPVIIIVGIAAISFFARNNR